MFGVLACRGTATTAGFGMRIYKKVGTDATLISAYASYQQFTSALRLDWLLQLALVALSVLAYARLSAPWLISVCLHVPLALCWLPAGLAAARREWRSAMLALLTAASLQPPLCAVQFFILSRAGDDSVRPSACRRDMRDHLARASFEMVLYAIMAVALCVRIASVALGARLALYSFRRGLREHVHDPRPPASHGSYTSDSNDATLPGGSDNLAGSSCSLGAGAGSGNSAGSAAEHLLARVRPPAGGSPGSPFSRASI